MKISLALSFVVSISASTVHAGTVTRHEFVRNGVTYIEETNIGANGNVSRSLYPKPGKDAEKLDTEMKSAEALAKPVPRAHRGGSMTRGQAAQLSQAIGACKPFSFGAAHPMFQDFMIEYKVHGMESGKCRFTQTLPGGEIQTCQLSESQRDDIKKNGATALQKWMGDPKVCPVKKR
jgi:hypothetical protein